jgi:signal transduction histidine kinase
VAFGVWSALSTPILDAQGEVVGFVEIHNKQDGSGFSPADQDKLASVVHAAALALQNALAYERIRHTEQQLLTAYEEARRLSERLQSAREEERAHIAREIHDELGQQLTGLKMDVAKLRRMANGLDPSAVQRLEEYSQALDLAVQTVRRIASELRPSILDHFGLLAALEWQLDEFKRRSSIGTRWTNHADEAALPAERATAVFRVFQESLTNIARHAQATHVDVKIEATDDQLVLQVSDNGRGITPAEISGAQSLGLAGMRERIGLLGGMLDIQGAPDQGTTVLVRVPLSASSALGSTTERPA